MEKKFFSPYAEDPVFLYYWESYVGDLKGRSNFKLGHLHSLELLCGLYVEYHEMCQLIKDEGKSYQTEGRHGMQIKQRPEVEMRAKTLAEIRQLTKQLGIILDKDAPNPEPDDKGNPWKKTSATVADGSEDL